MTYFEEAFLQFVRTSLGELIREQVAEHLEMLRGPAWVTKKEAAQLLGCSTVTPPREAS
jgi:hypothetical protein